MQVIEPGSYGDSISGVEDIAGRRVVNDNGVLQVSSKLGQVLVERVSTAIGFRVPSHSFRYGCSRTLGIVCA